MTKEKILSPKGGGGRVKRRQEGPKGEEGEQEGVYDHMATEADGVRAISRPHWDTHPLI